MTWLFTDPLSGSQELGVIIGAALVAYGFYRVGVFLLNSHARLVIVRKPNVVTFPPEPTAFMRDVDGDHRLVLPDSPNQTDALYDAKRLIGQRAGR